MMHCRDIALTGENRNGARVFKLETEGEKGNPWLSPHLDMHLGGV